jgi:plasmanylethanolamine desaturase
MHVAAAYAAPHATLRVRDRHPPAHRALEMFGIVAATSLVALLLTRAFAQSPAWVLAAAPVGYVVADLASGFVHWMFDRFFATTTPLIGANFVTPFREHHTDPADITRHGFVETAGNTCLATLPVLGAVAFVPLASDAAAFLVATFAFASLATFATNQFHKWAHTENPPSIVVWLQQKNLILSPEHHAIHHEAPYESHYCITVGWLNGTLSRADVWRRMERFAERVLHLHVYRG